MPQAQFPLLHQFVQLLKWQYAKIAHCTQFCTVFHRYLKLEIEILKEIKTILFFIHLDYNVCFIKEKK